MGKVESETWEARIDGRSRLPARHLVVVSPLLANIYMHRFLRAWRERGKGQEYDARIVNYADDFVILSRGRAREALVWTRWVMGQLGLRLNETKTSLRNAMEEDFDFLGYTFRAGALPEGWSHVSGGKAVEEERPGNQGAWPEVRDHLNRILRGWSNYFGYGTFDGLTCSGQLRLRTRASFPHTSPQCAWARHPAVFG